MQEQLDEKKAEVIELYKVVDGINEYKTGVLFKALLSSLTGTSSFISLESKYLLVK